MAQSAQAIPQKSRERRESRGRFITLEGGHGAGKTTLVQHLARRLQVHGKTVLTLREPGGTALGQTVRDWVLARDRDEMDSLAELLLFMAARVQLIAQRLEPALAQGTWVVCDRFVDSSIVYQGMKLGVQQVQDVAQLCLGSCWPDLTLILDIDPARARDRLLESSRDVDASYYQAKDVAFHQAVREGFLAQAARAPDRCLVVDAQGSLEDVGDRLWQAVEARLGGASGASGPSVAVGAGSPS